MLLHILAAQAVLWELAHSLTPVALEVQLRPILAAQAVVVQPDQSVSVVLVVLMVVLIMVLVAQAAVVQMAVLVAQTGQ
jgi:hypothetical protein